MFKKILSLYHRVSKRGYRDAVWRLILIGKAEVNLVIRMKRCCAWRAIEPPNCFYFSNGAEVTEIVSNDVRKSVIREAERILKHEMVLFGGTRYRFGKKIDWLADPISKKRWSVNPWNRINIRNEAYGDVRILWELNRNKHFVTLGKAYQYTGDDRYCREFIRQLSSWLRDNPVGVGVNWTSTLEVAMRVISWLWCYFLFSPCKEMDGIRTKLINGISEHGEYIYKFRSEYLHPSNHIIGEATALYLISAFMPFLDNGLRWRRKAKAILDREVKRQVNFDGGDKEQAFCYHRFVIDLLLSVLIASKRINDVLPISIRQTTEKMIEFMIYVMKTRGSLSMIGDSDGARGVPIFDTNRFWHENEIFCIGAIVFNRGDFKFRTDDFSEGAAWLLGLSGYKRFCDITTETPSACSMGFLNSGYYVMRDSWKGGLSVIVRAGPQGIGRVAGHGHADHLSFELAYDGKDIIVDPGTYTYQSSNRYRNYFRSTPAHNSVIVDQKSQTEPLGDFDWKRVISSKLIAWRPGSKRDVVDAYHRGYWPIVHRRRVVLYHGKNCILIKDYLYGEKSHRIDLFLHMGPEMKIIESQHSYVLAAHNDFYVGIHQLNTKMDLCIIDDHVSADYGQLIRSMTLNYSVKKELPLRLATAILVGSRRQCQPSLKTVKELVDFSKQK